ncbi:hypothetical protein ABNG03_10185 [Halorubrum sp. RMP-47]|uniref:Uncharacterized protein n=1 Tax=Halorubrum miltondacostae TaxID=3076378 RepID=A0ABD5M016_9EURY
MTDNPEIADTKALDDRKELIRSVSERPPSDGPYLAESTARYILFQSNENDTANESDIEDVLSDLPLRLTRFLYDLAILSQGGYLDNLDTNWDKLNDVPYALSLVSRKSHGRETVSNRNNSHFTLGFDIGLGLSTLTGTISEDKRASEFLAGFTTAYSTDHYQRTHDTNDREYSDEIDTERKQLLEQYGIEPTEYIDRLIQTYNLGWSNIVDRDPLTAKEATQEYLEERISDRFGRCSHLRTELEEEWDSIGEASVLGMSAEEALKALWELTSRKHTNLEGGRKAANLVNSAEIAKEAGKRSMYRNQVSHVLNRLSTEGKEPSEEVDRTFEAKEIVQYDGNEWKLTGYGALLLYHVFEKREDPAWIQEAALRKSLPDEVSRYTETGSRILENGLDDYYDE